MALLEVCGKCTGGKCLRDVIDGIENSQIAYGNVASIITESKCVANGNAPCGMQVTAAYSVFNNPKTMEAGNAIVAGRARDNAVRSFQKIGCKAVIKD